VAGYLVIEPVTQFVHVASNSFNLLPLRLFELVSYVFLIDF